MEALSHPASCEICRAKLRGAAETEREIEDYFLDTDPAAKSDWRLCPRCKRAVCAARCWDAARGYCGSCRSSESSVECPRCQKALTGAIEVVETETEGVPTILLKETPDRNWIECDLCSLVICKACCRNPASGFCDQCLDAQAGDLSPEKRHGFGTSISGGVGK